MVRIKNTNKFFFTLILGILIGMIIGSIIITIFVSYRIDKYYQKINIYYTLLQEKDFQLEKLNESLNKNKYILKEINIELVNINDEINEIELKKHIKEKYINLIGREVKSIDINIVSEVIDNRIMKFGDLSYKLKVSKVLLSDTLEIYIVVEEIE